MTVVGEPEPRFGDKIAIKINDRILTSDLIMKSQNTQLNIKDSILDLEKKLIEAKINSTIKDKKFIIDVKGETSNPKISLNAKDLLKEKLDKQLEKKRDKIEEKLNKVLGGKAEDEKAKELINNLKSIFLNCQKVIISQKFQKTGKFLNKNLLKTKIVMRKPLSLLMMMFCALFSAFSTGNNPADIRRSCSRIKRY